MKDVWKITLKMAATISALALLAALAAFLRGMAFEKPAIQCLAGADAIVVFREGHNSESIDGKEKICEINRKLKLETAVEKALLWDTTVEIRWMRGDDCIARISTDDNGWDDPGCGRGWFRSAEKSYLTDRKQFGELVLLIRNQILPQKQDLDQSL